MAPCLSQVLVDPVCMFTVWPQLLQNFIYKLPKLGGGILGLIDGARYLFSRDLIISEAFCRKFVWHKVGSGHVCSFNLQNSLQWRDGCIASIKLTLLPLFPMLSMLGITRPMLTPIQHRSTSCCTPSIMS